jgi:hypothetical protein
VVPEYGVVETLFHGSVGTSGLFFDMGVRRVVTWDLLSTTLDEKKSTANGA